MGRVANFFTEQHIPLAIQQRQQMISLDAKFEQMETQITALQAENLRLQAQVNPLQREVDKLREQIQSAKEKSAAKALDEKAETLLSAIARGIYTGAKGGGTIIGGTHEQAAYYLGVLKLHRFVRYARANYTLDGRYVATHEGLEYLHKAGKL